MKAISLWQFWASAIALRLKWNETRSWATNHRGPIAIHAAKKDTPILRGCFDSMMCRADFGQRFRAANLNCFSMLPKGAVVAVAELVEVLPTEIMLKRGIVSDLEMNLGDYGINRFAWRLENIQPLREPYFIAGHQGLFDVPDEILTLVNS
jgi:hypothetical protein